MLMLYEEKNIFKIIFVIFRAPQTEKQSHMLDLLDVNLGEASGSSAQNDPWSIPVTAPPPRPQVLHTIIHTYSNM